MTGAINLIRGLLRLWVVLALVWVGLTTWLQWDALASIPVDATIRVQSADGVIPEDLRRAKDLETVYQAGEMPPDMRADYEKVRPMLLQKLQDEGGTWGGATVPERPRRRDAVAFVLLPPFGVLVFGVGLFWVAQGFRSRSI
jgi:hypothetical protein